VFFDMEGFPLIDDGREYLVPPQLEMEGAFCR